MCPDEQIRNKSQENIVCRDRAAACVHAAICFYGKCKTVCTLIHTINAWLGRFPAEVNSTLLCAPGLSKLLGNGTGVELPGEVGGGVGCCGVELIQPGSLWR